jgi:exonuclease SbcC
MILQRVRLKGFLCYKDEQEIDFDGNSTLWMLSGLNGSGKSSIFDAVTFALFGHHRGGGQHNQELINKDSDGLLVEFDFLLDGKGYRAKRTLKRDGRGGARSTQQLFGLDCNNGKPLPLEDTGSRDGFNKWISENIGLNYETFTSSVLLLQGKAEKLLDSKPEGRRTVLASIVDLERYEKLHEKADAERRAVKGMLDEKHNQLEALPEVKAEQIAEAERAIGVAEEARQRASAEVDRWRDLEHQARNWVELQSRLAAARQRREQAQRLLAEAGDIEKNMERLRELREVLRPLREIIKQRGVIRDAELTGKSLLQEKDKATEQLARNQSALKQERDKRTQLQKLIETEEKNQRELTPQLLAATAQMEKLKEHERHSAELERILGQLAPLPADAAAEVNQARAVCERLANLMQLLPQLTRFHEDRESLRQAAQRQQAAQLRLTEVETRGKQWKAELDRLGPLAKAADAAARQAKDRETETRTLVTQARENLREITQLDGAKRCRHCGQELTPGHLQEEKHRRTEELRQTEGRLKEVVAEWKKAADEEQRLGKELESAQQTYWEARDSYREAQGLSNQARDDVARLQAECGRIYTALPDEPRRRIRSTPTTDWLTTQYPTVQDLEALRGEAADYPAARQFLRNAEETAQQWNKLKVQESEKRATLQRLQTELPADREAVRSKHTDLTLRGRALENELKSKRLQLKDADADVERLTREGEQAQFHLNRFDLELKSKELERQHARQTIAVNQKALPSTWQKDAETAGAAEFNRWDAERAQLEGKGVEQRIRELQQAKVNRDVYRQDVEDLEAQQQDFAAEARRDPADIKAELEKARATEEQHEQIRSEARQQLAQLERDRKRRQEIGEEYIHLEGELSLYKTLAELLGKNRLQLYLVRQAEKQVVDCANAVLDRLSGGQLYLKLKGEADGEGGSDRALDLDAYNRVTGEKPINVAFLSGSQKFRVAVSLALGIGQYASKQHRPIESVIIDEGFGCLDSQGRQVMIQELQNLRSQMRCILLVSHQEEFAEAFADGYHFELESGATRVTRFQR